MIAIEEIVKDKDSRTKYKVRCTKCGYRFQVRVSRYKEDAKCKACSTTESNIDRTGDHKGSGVISKTFYNKFKNGAKRRNVPFEVTVDYLDSLWTGTCALSGMTITAPTKTDGNGNCQTEYTTASLDRIDSSLGYIIGNVQWVNKHINIMKNGYSQEEFIFMCHQVVSCHANQQPSVLNGNRKVSTKVQRLEGEDNPTNNPSKSARLPE
jgi:hypothetical protein